MTTYLSEFTVELCAQNYSKYVTPLQSQGFTHGSLLYFSLEVLRLITLTPSSLCIQ